MDTGIEQLKLPVGRDEPLPINWLKYAQPVIAKSVHKAVMMTTILFLVFMVLLLLLRAHPAAAQASRITF
jgi:hypothetical protein